MRFLAIALVAAAAVALPVFAQRATAVRAPSAPTPVPAPSEPHTLVVWVLDEACVPLDDREPFVHARGSDWIAAATRLEPGVWSFRTLPDTGVFVGRFSITRGLVEQELRTGAPGLETRTTLVADPVQELAGVTARVRGPSGETGGIEVSLRAPGSDRALVVQDGALTDGRCTSRFAVAPGSYTLRAMPSNTRWVFPAEERIALHPGSDRKVDLFPELGGQVRFRIASPPRTRLTGHLETAAGRRVALAYATVSDGTAAMFTRSPLHPGLQQLVVSLHGYRPAIVPVDARAGVLVDADLELLPE